MFVVANSLAISNKAESAVKHYNLRVVECRWAAAAAEYARAWAKPGTQAGVRLWMLALSTTKTCLL